MGILDFLMPGLNSDSFSIFLKLENNFGELLVKKNAKKKSNTHIVKISVPKTQPIQVISEPEGVFLLINLIYLD
jgi:hypothetical protein